jgi:acyl-CoA thioester hydrolase
VSGLRIYATAIQPEWIDYNGHLRDAYYVLIVSAATDALMDRIGLDAAYRARTQCTLYTVEMHVHFLDEVKAADTALVDVRILGVDHKRIHAAFDLRRAAASGVVAVVEMMLLHVRQEPSGAASTPFPPAVSAALAQLQAAHAGAPAPLPGSRRMELRGASRAS